MSVLVFLHMKTKLRWILVAIDYSVVHRKRLLELRSIVFFFSKTKKNENISISIS